MVVARIPRRTGLVACSIHRDSGMGLFFLRHSLRAGLISAWLGARRGSIARPQGDPAELTQRSPSANSGACSCGDLRTRATDQRGLTADRATVWSRLAPA